MAKPNIIECKIFIYECEKCGKECTMTLSGQEARRLEDSGYFCPYCGTKHTPNYPRDEEHRFATDEEAGFVDDMRKEGLKITSTPKITQKGEKSAAILQAEDRNTQARCPDGGWWNPITKQCQGEGVGHNLELDNDDQV